MWTTTSRCIPHRTLVGKMEITREYLEGEIVMVREQATAAANVVQQAAGAEMVLRSTLARLEAEEEKNDVEHDSGSSPPALVESG